jgi:hypothetical protein
VPRFLSGLAIAVTGAFLVVATEALSLSTVTWLAFAVSIGTLVVSVAVADGYRSHLATVLIAGATAVVSAWTIVTRLVFSQATAEDLALGSGLAIAGLPAVGLSRHERSSEHAAVAYPATAEGSESRLAAAA